MLSKLEPYPAGCSTSNRCRFEERNSTPRCFTNPRWQARLPDWEQTLVKRLRQDSAVFAKLWDRHEVLPLRNLTTRFVHPDAGLLRFGYTHLWFGPRSETRPTTYTPADEETAAKLPTC